MAEVVLDGVTRVYPDGTRALSDLDLRVADGELLVLTGPSGSGKTSLLRVVAGLDRQASGHVWIGGRVVDDLPSRDRDVALVPQERGLYPYLTARGNLGFALRLKGLSNAEVQRRVQAEARVFRLERLLDHLPGTLAAGSRQSLAVGRATTRRPQVFLLDEPLSAVDPAERARRRAEVVRLQRGLGVTTLYVTNDQSEALGIADRLAVIRDGAVQQVGHPLAVLERPVNRFVAGFVGPSGMCFVDAVVEEQGGLGWYRIGGQRVRVPGGLPGPLRALAGRRVVVGARPQHLGDARADPGHPVDGRLASTVDRVERLGRQDLVRFTVGGAQLCACFAPGQGPPRGAPVEVTVQAAELQVFDAETGAARWHGRSTL